MKKQRPVKKQSNPDALGEYDGDELSPDEINPDWPKRTPDTMADILAMIKNAESVSESESD